MSRNEVSDDGKRYGKRQTVEGGRIEWTPLLEANNKIEELIEEIYSLRSELQKAMKSHEDKTKEIKNYKELFAISKTNIGKAIPMASGLENYRISLEEEKRKLQDQLTIANEKLKENKASKKLVYELQSLISDIESQLVEGEKLRNKLNNTILELKAKSSS